MFQTEENEELTLLCEKLLNKVEAKQSSQQKTKQIILS